MRFEAAGQLAMNDSSARRAISSESGNVETAGPAIMPTERADVPVAALTASGAIGVVAIGLGAGASMRAIGTAERGTIDPAHDASNNSATPHQITRIMPIRRYRPISSWDRHPSPSG